MTPKQLAANVLFNVLRPFKGRESALLASGDFLDKVTGTTNVPRAPKAAATYARAKAARGDATPSTPATDVGSRVPADDVLEDDVGPGPGMR